MMMEPHRRLLILLCLLHGQDLLAAFNIDAKRPQVFRGPEEAQFGYAVLQYEAEGQKWVLVGAPWDGPDGSRQGDVYRCMVGAQSNSTCAKVNLGEQALRNVSKHMQNMHFGMALTQDARGGFVACAPLWSQECGSSMYSTGICASVDASFRPTGTIAPTAQRCSTYLDIVILLDGSNSIYPWFEVQNFLSNILSKFFIGPDQIQVGVLQYGEKAVHEWSLKDYTTSREVIEAAKNISRQEGRETRTAFAIHKSCSEAFSPERGGREGATRLLIVVTDGESHDGEELPIALAECEKRDITRYAIAVLGNYMRRQQNPDSFINEIKYIASDPDEKYFFNVTDEAALNDIVDALGDRIFSLEGTHGLNESSFELEMSQVGFSIHVLEDGILFGMVGAYNWDGAVLKESKDSQVMSPRATLEKEFPVKMKNHAAYLGYTVSSITLRSGRVLYVAGAPRFKHKGKVILFEMSQSGDLTISQALVGEQIGSYFGSEVCPVDVNRDGVTDVLLVAAPMFLGHHHKETGRVYIYRVGQALLTLNGTLHTDRKPQDSRFGYAMASASDLNQDGLDDVVVGAPLEDNHRGAVYIYHGRGNTILPSYKQRIDSASFHHGLTYFGRSVSAKMDLDGDGLVDLTIGSQGAVVVLRSRGIVRVNATLQVIPPSINMLQKNCVRQGKESVCLNVTACFSVSSKSSRKLDVPFGLHYNLSLDDRRGTPRAVFDKSFQRLTSVRVRISTGVVLCMNVSFHVIDTADYLKPIGVLLRFNLSDSQSSPVLDDRCPSSVRRLVPFFKDCGEDDECITDLSLRARLDIVGTRDQPHIIRRDQRKVAVEVELENRRENSYNTSMKVWFSRNLLFSSVSGKGETLNKVECTAVSSNSRYCSISYPVQFILEFEYSCAILLNRVQIKMSASSDNTEMNDTLHDNSVQLTANVRYEPEVFTLSESSLNRYEVQPILRTSQDSGPEFITKFKVQYGDCYPLHNVSVHIHTPAMGYGSSYFMSVSRIISENVTCVLSNNTRPGTALLPIHPADLLHTPIVNCSNSLCEVISCQIPTLPRNSEVSLSILRIIHNHFFTNAKFRSVKVISEFILNVREDGGLFTDNARHRTQSVLELLHPVLLPLSLWILIGSVIGGLLLLALIIFILWKLGFFTRKVQGEEKEEAAAADDNQ
ncbi:PREDICTED: integrin alpha-10 [Nanorana parkeri]|uniref:integrin alpha-10 n=1 Tax=Nanorana parkeri TaxID=125878 RepID=UPI0008549C90|nr:PREDICTED: integrin alpha-10 [Nanorana parkeri]